MKFLRLKVRVLFEGGFYSKAGSIRENTGLNFQLEGRALLQLRKTDNSNDEFLRFPSSDFLDQGIKLKLRTFSIQCCKNHSCIHLFSYLKLLL